MSILSITGLRLFSIFLSKRNECQWKSNKEKSKSPLLKVSENTVALTVMERPGTQQHKALNTTFRQTQHSQVNAPQSIVNSIFRLTRSIHMDPETNLFEIGKTSEIML
jgi:hypothetical protein